MCFKLENEIRSGLIINRPPIWTKKVRENSRGCEVRLRKETLRSGQRSHKIPKRYYERAKKLRNCALGASLYTPKKICREWVCEGWQTLPRFPTIYAFGVGFFPAHPSFTRFPRFELDFPSQV